MNVFEEKIDMSERVNKMPLIEEKAKLPGGTYTAEWVNTKTGKVDKKETFQHRGGKIYHVRTLHSPKYTDDIALRIRRVPKGR